MSRENLEKLHALLDKEIGRIADKTDISPGELENAKMAICVIKDIEEIVGSDDYDGYSRTRGRSPVTGRYVSREGGMRGGYSGHSIKDRMISKLEHMMDETDSEYEKNEIANYIRTLEMNK